MFYLQGRSRSIASVLIAACVLWLGHPASAQTVSVSLSLTKYDTVVHGSAGAYVGVSPGVLHVHVGDRVVFVNDDNKVHTATGLTESVAFPEDPHWTDEALRAGGAIGSGAWSTGELKSGASSVPILAKKSGTYLFGCFFDYSAGMRGEIVVEP
jgi:plastocyanin